MNLSSKASRNTKFSGEEYVDLKLFVQITVRHWKRILSSVVIFLVAAICYCIFTVPMYKNSAVIMVGTEEHGGAKNISALFENNIISTSSGVENDMFILGSRSIAEKVANRLNFESGYILTADEVRNGVQVSNPVKGSTMVQIDYFDTDTVRANLVISALIDEYMKFYLSGKKYAALVTGRYADNRIAELANNNGENGSEISGKQLPDKAMINVINGIGAFLGRKINRYKVVPELTQTGDIQLDNLIEKYNELQIRRKMLVENSTEVKEIQEFDKVLSDMRNILFDGLEIRRNMLETAIADGWDESKEQTARKTVHEYGLDKSVCLHLMQQKENAEIKAAVAEADVTLIDAPYGNEVPVRPNIVAAFLIAVVAGLVLPYLILYSRYCLKSGEK